MPSEYRQKVSLRYRQLYEMITAGKFIINRKPIIAKIKNNLINLNNPV